MKNIREYKTLQTQSIAAAAKDQLTALYIIDCLNRYFAGDYGVICAEDKEANRQESNYTCGHILGRYEAYRELSDDIYIETCFDDESPLSDINSNYTLIMLRRER